MTHTKLKQDQDDQQKYVATEFADDISGGTIKQEVFSVRATFRRYIERSSLQGIGKVTSPRIHTLRRFDIIQ